MLDDLLGPDWLRFAEFSQACVERSLEGKAPRVIYYGILRDDSNHKKVLADLESSVFRHWDQLATAPPQARPQPEISLAVEGLSLLSSTADGPVWPDHLLQKFSADSAQYKELKTIQEAFEKEFPPRRPSVRSSGTGGGTSPGPVRVQGRPDFSVDSARSPLDFTRMVEPRFDGAPNASDRPGGTKFTYYISL